jgi:hypothetical protein
VLIWIVVVDELLEAAEGDLEFLGAVDWPLLLEVVLETRLHLLQLLLYLHRA